MILCTFKQQLKAYLFYIWMCRWTKGISTTAQRCCDVFYDSNTGYKTADLLMTPAARKKIDFELHLLPPAASCQRRSGHWWYFWARWSMVGPGVFSRILLGAQRIFRLHLPRHPYKPEPRSQTVSDVLNWQCRKVEVVQLSSQVSQA